MIALTEETLPLGAEVQHGHQISGLMMEFLVRTVCTIRQEDAVVNLTRSDALRKMKKGAES